MEDYKKEYEQLAEFIKDLYPHMSDYYKEKTEGMLPELKESEDEKVRKQILDCFRTMKQQGCFPSKHKEQYDSWIAWLKKQGEQTSTDKIEPKFKVGDWIVTPNSETKQIEKITFGNYYFTDKTLYNIIDTDNNGHLWTIEDAKDGDVLCYRNDIFLVKSYVLFNRVVSHCTYSKRFIPHDIYSFTRADFIKIYPATNEQRNFLFFKIKNAGYEWDAEKKELKKIEQKLAWGEEDEKNYKAVLKIIRDSNTSTQLANNLSDWLQSFTQRV